MRILKRYSLAVAWAVLGATCYALGLLLRAAVNSWLGVL